ncbi:Sporangia induced Predicted protein [Phytophthora cinnamomi]|uniref:Sporangia induced Predicted protein n=1 Tax=Phytophthora cinnamomi TaxID=4785 RepID=UPI0035594784|nr:Sporangia induced Predicted protein [Phytophthora cinnamomi]
MRVLQVASLALLCFWTGVRVTTADSCSDQVSTGDQWVGISAEDSPTCPDGGGLGCFGGSSTCRFCMTFSTAQSAHLLACTTASTSTPTVTVAPTAAPTTAPTTAAPTTAPTPATANTSEDDCPGSLPVA